MNVLAKIIRGSLDAYFRLLKVVLTALMLFMVVPIVLQILSRYSGIIPRYIWTEEVARFCFVWIVMIGSMIAVREESHFKVDLLPEQQQQFVLNPLEFQELRFQISIRPSQHWICSQKVEALS